MDKRIILVKKGNKSRKLIIDFDELKALNKFLGKDNNRNGQTNH